MMDLKNFEVILDYSFKDKDLLKKALTHASAAEKPSGSYERLEFLGDRVLGIVVAHMLYHTFPDETEGDLAKRLAFLVSAPLCSEVAANLKVEEYINAALGSHYLKTSKKHPLLADVCESIIAALYIDGGLDVAWRFVESQWRPLLERDPSPPRDPKSELQEWLQSRSQKVPVYKLEEKQGPDHDPVFQVSLTIDPYGTVIGRGVSLRKAEKDAALEMLKRIRTHG
jgi:ribonuclease-3